MSFIPRRHGKNPALQKLFPASGIMKDDRVPQKPEREIFNGAALPISGTAPLHRKFSGGFPPAFVSRPSGGRRGEPGKWP